MPKFNVRIRRICTDYDYATVEIEAPTAEEARRFCSNGPENYLDDTVEFDSVEVAYPEYEVCESYEVTQVEEPHAPTP